MALKHDLSWWQMSFLFLFWVPFNFVLKASPTSAYPGPGLSPIKTRITDDGPWSPGDIFPTFPCLLHRAAILCVSPPSKGPLCALKFIAELHRRRKQSPPPSSKAAVLLYFFLLLKGYFLCHQLSNLPWGKFLSLTPSNQCWRVILIIEFLSLFL